MIHYANSWSDRLAWTVATLAGVGCIPKAPGTWGTLATVPLYGWLQQAGGVTYAIVFVSVLLIGTWATSVACRLYARSDPSQVVVDEAAGFLLTMLFAPEGWVWVVVGFGLFRLFDITKPWPVGWLDRELPPPWGVMVDDLAAGVYAGVSMMVLARMSLP